MPNLTQDDPMDMDEPDMDGTYRITNTVHEVLWTNKITSEQTW